MKGIVAALAFASSLLAFLVIAGTGLFLAVVEQSGARGSGLLLALGGVIAFAAALYVNFAARAGSPTRGGKAFTAAGTFLAVVPVAALSAAALIFAGLPLGSAIPVLDWTFFAIGVALALGAVAIIVLGYLRIAEGSGPARVRSKDGRDTDLAGAEEESSQAGRI